MERGWLGYERPAAIQRVSVSNHGNGADPHLRENSPPLELHNLERLESHDSSSPTRECEICQVGEAGACAEKIGNSGLGSRTPTKSRQESGDRHLCIYSKAIIAIPARWRSTALTSRKRERSDSISCTKSILTYAKPPEVSPTEPDATRDAGNQAGGSLRENFAACDMW